MQLSQKNTLWQKMKQQKWLILMVLPFVIHLIIFAYLPMWGVLLAFQDFKPLVGGFFKQRWIGLENFVDLFTSNDLLRVLYNTLGMSIIGLVLGSFFTVLLAILIFETRDSYFKKVVQTSSYLPHFISWVVAASFVADFLSADGGLLNNILLKLHIIEDPIFFRGEPRYFWWIIGWSGLWKGVGWGAIIYLSAMTSINPQLYDAAEIDGAGRIDKIRYITIPGIQSTFVILLILSIGALISTGWEQQFLLQTPLVADRAENFGLYTFTEGLRNGRYSYGTAAGLFNSVVNIILLLSANKIAKKLEQETLF